MHQPAANDDAAVPDRRWPGLDAARGVALVAMAVFHLTWDLSLFGLIETDPGSAPAWRLFAHAIAGSFLVMVGISLVLAHGAGVRRRPFLRRLAVLTLAAATVTVATWFVFPDTFIYFGILHAIALSSLLALPFLRAPSFLVLAAALLCIVAPELWRSPDLNGPALLWLGLGTAIRPTNDYEPILPWFGYVLVGVAAARLLLPRLPSLPAWWRDSRIGQLLALAGRHSLTVYLVHQPVLFGLVWLAAQVVGPLPATGAAFRPECEANCQASGQGQDLCLATCLCAEDELKATGLWDRTIRNHLSRDDRQAVTAIVQQCLRAKP